MSRKPYVRPISKTSWFMQQAEYKSYMLHEISSFFVAIYSVILIFGLFRLSQGQAAWEGWVAGVTSPLGVVFHLIAFAFSVIHTTAWFTAVPQALRIQRGESFVPGKLIVGAHYGGLAAFSLFMLILAGVA
jgi:fumarate reductase subunit C